MLSGSAFPREIHLQEIPLLSLARVHRPNLSPSYPLGLIIIREIFIATRIVYFRPRAVGGPGENRVSRSNSLLLLDEKEKERGGRKKNFPIQARLPSARINEGGAIRRGRRIIRGPPASGAALADAIARPSLSQPTHNSCPSLLSKSIQLPRGYFSGFGVTRSPIWCSRRESTSIIPITRRTVTLVGIDLRRRNKKERKPWRGRRFSLSLC